MAILVRRVPGGIASSWLHRIEPGQGVRFTGPFGEFRLADDPDCQVVCVAGGCGLAPVRAIVESVLDIWPDRPIWLFYGSRTRAEAVWLDRFDRLARTHSNFQLICLLSDEQPGDWQGESGLIHLAVEKHLPPSSARRQAYLCGPEGMIAAVQGVLDAKGFRRDQVFSNTF